MNELINLAQKNEKTVMGLMSGTSIDAIDATVVKIIGSGENSKIEIIGFYSNPYDQELQKSLLNFTEKSPVSDFARLDMIVGESFANTANECVSKFLTRGEKLDLLGSHGQTVCHNPPSRTNGTPYTLQLGNLDLIAEITGTTTVGDFRSRDVAAGGEGAPIIPHVDHILFNQKYETVIAQNIGGISNITIINKNRAKMEAFDTGPGNMIMDGLIRLHTTGKSKYDAGGELASKGNINTPLLKELLSDDYFAKPPPKSTGSEKFGKVLVNKLYDMVIKKKISIEDLLRTSLEFTVESIAIGYEKFIYPKVGFRKIILSGGGAGNKFLVRRLKARLPQYEIIISDEYGIPYQAKESIGMAVLANELISGKYTNVPSCTGAGIEVPMGKIALGRK